MSMISEQVKEMKDCERRWRTCEYVPSHEPFKLLAQAANTIEALSEKVTKANEELERWHTDHINEKIKNPFAHTSTLICHNCNHKDEYIEELEAEVEKLKANMERSKGDCGSGWIMANVKKDNYICDYRLKDYYGVILITYETLKKKRYTKAVLCNYGYISKQIGGEIIAWQFLPDSCKVENPYK